MYGTCVLHHHSSFDVVSCCRSKLTKTSFRHRSSYSNFTSKMKIAIALGIVVIAMSLANSNATSVIDFKWALFQHYYNKTYGTLEEYLHRKSVFTENYKSLAKHNELYRKGLKFHDSEINAFTDLTHAEFLENVKGPVEVVSHNEYTGGDFPVPDAIDYRTKGYVTPVKNQGSCSSDWAFSAAGAIEGQLFQYMGKLIPLSVQNLIDCSSIYKNHGCKGGTVFGAFNYTINVGINTEEDYPYEAKDGECRYNASRSIDFGGGFMSIARNETFLKYAIGLLGPVSAVIDITQKDFRSYRSGVYYNANCSSSNVNHAVLIVGYGTDERGRDYWIVKNSWGIEWGEYGYVLMARNRDNNCGIATMASVPTFDRFRV